MTRMTTQYTQHTRILVVGGRRPGHVSMHTNAGALSTRCVGFDDGRILFSWLRSEIALWARQLGAFAVFLRSGLVI